MTETITLTFTKNTPDIVLKPVAPQELPISMAEAVLGATPTANDIEGFSVDPLAYYILAST